MAKNKEYAIDQIKVLNDREHVRLRTNVYLGTMEATTFPVPIFGEKKFEIKEFTFIPAVYKAVGEILDNTLDEFTKIKNGQKKLSISALPEEGKYDIEDNGRGIPIDKHPDVPGKYGPEVALGMLRSGRNFNDSSKEEGVIGVNGVGSACVNYCCSEFDIKVHRDGKKYTQSFSDGAAVIKPPKITSVASDKTGTGVAFQLDTKVFKNVSLDQELMRNRAIEIAFNCPDVAVSYNDEKFRFKRGFEDVIKEISSNYYCFETKHMIFYVVFDLSKKKDEYVFTWVNNSYLFDGGLCNTQFVNAFFAGTEDYLRSDAKKLKCDVAKDDIKEGLVVFGFLKLKDAKYDSQAKTRLTGPNLRNEMAELIQKGWSGFARNNKDWLQTVLQRAERRHHHEADKDAAKEMLKKKGARVADLTDATSKDRSICRLFITEGDSAMSNITEVRNPLTDAAFPLGGKINNVYDARVSEILKMVKLTDVLAAIGLVPGQPVDRRSLRYGRVIIATDADTDGGDIFTLLICLFFKQWPELFDPKKPAFFYRLLAPNVAAYKGKTRLHFRNKGEYEAKKNSLNGYTIKYYKGLGSMVLEDWEMLIDEETALIGITDDGKMADTLELLFGENVEARKQWLMKKGS